MERIIILNIYEKEGLKERQLSSSVRAQSTVVEVGCHFLFEQLETSTPLQVPGIIARAAELYPTPSPINPAHPYRDSRSVSPVTPIIPGTPPQPKTGRQR